MRDDGADVHGGEEHRPMTDFGTPGVISAFRGPFHDGPPAEALEVVTPPLEKFGFSEVRRMILTYVVLTLCIMRSLAEWVLRREGRSAARDRKSTSELQSLMRISYAVFCLK